MKKKQHEILQYYNFIVYVLNTGSKKYNYINIIFRRFRLILPYVILLWQYTTFMETKKTKLALQTTSNHDTC